MMLFQVPLVRNPLVCEALLDVEILQALPLTLLLCEVLLQAGLLRAAVVRNLLLRRGLFDALLLRALVRTRAACGVLLSSGLYQVLLVETLLGMMLFLAWTLLACEALFGTELLQVQAVRTRLACGCPFYTMLFQAPQVHALLDPMLVQAILVQTLLVFEALFHLRLLQVIPVWTVLVCGGLFDPLLFQALLVQTLPVCDVVHVGLLRALRVRTLLIEHRLHASDGQEASLWRPPQQRLCRPPLRDSRHRHVVT
mmetsp:Transcript_68431/g.200184  ORF Transcript_68431/g.200184 Transcript_68431/m.200184 type:complete len:254 (+) Transcript_68431:738-1499(+)